MIWRELSLILKILCPFQRSYNHGSSSLCSRDASALVDCGTPDSLEPSLHKRCQFQRKGSQSVDVLRLCCSLLIDAP